MANTLYTAGADLMAGIETEDFRWLVAKSGYTPDADGDEFVADVSNEMSGTGYSRQLIDTPTRTPGTLEVVYDAADPDFGSVVAGETGSWLILYLHVTNDADSRLVCALQMSVPTHGGPYVINLSTAGIATLTQGA